MVGLTRLLQRLAGLAVERSEILPGVSIFGSVQGEDISMEIRIDKWIRTPKSADELTEYIGKHIVAHILTSLSPDDEVSGLLIGIDPEKKTASLRRYDSGAVREVPWNTANFRYTTFIESPFTELKVGDERRFEWFEDATGMPLDTPVTFVGMVSRRTQETAYLWVADPEGGADGWHAEIKAENVDRHALRPLNLKQSDGPSTARTRKDS
ncbi:hypothetical protein ACIPX0_49885 [Streptomyces sp. NPDC090075]|uniref:hypothetical protein n=1 Tax=Streptomyces sp. NPDC090075 TaxID=3365937 RepID=UPI0038238A35